MSGQHESRALARRVRAREVPATGEGRACPVCGLPDGGKRDFCSGCGGYLRWDDDREPAEIGPVRVPAQGATASAGEPPERVIVTLRRHDEAVDHAGVPDLYSVAPGAELALIALVSNHSGFVDGYILSIEGLSASWECTTTPQSLDLTPYGADGRHEDEMLLRIRAPRRPDVPAGRWPLRVAARSRSSGEIVGRADAVLALEPYVQFQTAVKPDRARGGRSAAFAVAVRNLGNAPVDVRVGAEDPEQRAVCSIQPEVATLEPGREGRVVVRVSGRRRFTGPLRERRVTITAEAGEDLQAHSAVFVQMPLLTPFRAALLRAALGLLAAGLLVLAALLPWSGDRIALCVAGPDCLGYQAFAKAYLGGAEIPDAGDIGSLQAVFEVLTSFGAVILALAAAVLLGLRTGALTWRAGMIAILGTIVLVILDRDLQAGPLAALLGGTLAVLAAVIPRG